MSEQKNIEIVRAVYAEWAMGKLDAGLDLYDADITFIAPRDTPDARRFVGLDQVRGWMRRWLEAWEDFTMTGEEFMDAGDTVIVRVRQRGVGKGSDMISEAEFFQLWTFRGKKVIRLEQFLDRSEALEAAGLYD